MFHNKGLRKDKTRHPSCIQEYVGLRPTRLVSGWRVDGNDPPVTITDGRYFWGHDHSTFTGLGLYSENIYYIKFNEN